VGGQADAEVGGQADGTAVFKKVAIEAVQKVVGSADWCIVKRQFAAHGYHYNRGKRKMVRGKRVPAVLSGRMCATLTDYLNKAWNTHLEKPRIKNNETGTNLRIEYRNDETKRKPLATKW
jgi:hypothetical protein